MDAFEYHKTGEHTYVTRDSEAGMDVILCFDPAGDDKRADEYITRVLSEQFIKRASGPPKDGRDAPDDAPSP